MVSIRRYVQVQSMRLLSSARYTQYASTLDTYGHRLGFMTILVFTNYIRCRKVSSLNVDELFLIHILLGLLAVHFRIE